MAQIGPRIWRRDDASSSTVAAAFEAAEVSMHMLQSLILSSRWICQSLPNS